MSCRGLRPVGFVLLMLGFGLRLDTGWQTLAWLLLALGAGTAVVGLGAPRDASDGASAFVPPRAAR